MYLLLVLDELLDEGKEKPIDKPSYCAKKDD